jgi:Zn-dependent peptidase ImmA (M78 family)/DNA-binding XRE family transcriptional regulator
MEQPLDTTQLDTIALPALGQRLHDVRKRRGLTQEEAAAAIGVARTTMVAIEKGERRIRATELLKLAHAYGQSVNDLLRDRPQLPAFAPQFRSQRVKWLEESGAFDASVAEFEALCRDYLELEQLAGALQVRQAPPEYPLRGIDVERLAQSVAQSERARLGLGDAPLPLLRTLLETEVGLRIFYMELNPAGKLAGLYAYAPDLGGSIAVNCLHPEERRRWTLAHAYAHFLVDRQRAEVLPEALVRYSDSERFAEAFARSFLLPESSVVRRFHQARANNKQFTLAELFLLAHDYGASLEAMTLRLEELRLLQPGLWDKLKAGGLRVREVQRELGLPAIPGASDLLPRHYQQLAFAALEQALITEGQFAHFLRADRITARQRVEALRETLDEAACFADIADFPAPTIQEDLAIA